MTTYKFMVCADCLFQVEFGFVESIDEDRADEVAQAVDALVHSYGEGAYICSGGAENAEEFSWDECECCGSELGGARDEVIVHTAEVPASA